ncbi:SPP1 gp17-like tail completion protein [Haloarcula virus HCTV-15]|nr:SPP1 gp17-like tail completion protein [Haloarcula virus HCTV-6]UBF22493.1 SPP1 gp17-like tail completion protein [Haloarcula virus HCTV-15]
MDVTTAIETLVSHLSARLAVPVRVSGMEDERPVPVVLIEDWDITDRTYHNSAFSGQAVDPEDGVEKRYHRFYYDMRVELVVRHHDDVLAHRVLDSLRRELAMVREEPYLFHDDLNDLKMRGSGGINHQFIEPKETELQQAIVLSSFHEVKRAISQYDTIEDILNDFTIID